MEPKRLEYVLRNNIWKSYLFSLFGNGLFAKYLYLCGFLLSFWMFSRHPYQLSICDIEESWAGREDDSKSNILGV